MSDISKLKDSPDLQAVAETKDGHRAFIMRGVPGGEYFERDYYILDGGRHVGSEAFTMNEIRKMFSSGLTLLQGSIPDKENRP